ncbi:MAG: hypothetical protein LQ346_005343 [Caloplaca aetnensis]|nr:MAG: hypothetical protein LQ346_005343 [Caloplaca aetnensis]
MEKTDSSGASLAAAALAVALAALSIATLQLLGQFFATADGYRRCQPSVMGAWAQYTKLRWKWSEMRFETLFITPEIFLQKYQPTRGMTSTPIQDLNWVTEYAGATERSHHGSETTYHRVESLDPNLVGSDPGTGVHHERVCWLSFLAAVRDNENETIMDPFATLTHRAACRLVRRSWDFMPPDVIRPLAMTSIGDIAIMIERLGMTWQAFRPEEGEMRAEGNGHMVYSTFVRSIGPILQYVNGNIPAAAAREKFSESIITPQSRTPPTAEVDMMRFGMLPCHNLMGQDFITMGTLEDIQASLNYIDKKMWSWKRVFEDRGTFDGMTFGFPDVIPLAAPMLRAIGSCKIRLPMPTDTCASLLTRKEGFLIFRQRLDEYIANNMEDAESKHARWVLEIFDDLDRLSEFWKDDLKLDFPATSENISFLDIVSRYWDDTTVYFEELEAMDCISFKYEELVACHIRHAVNYRREAHQRIEDNEQRYHEGRAHLDWLVEGMHLYWDYLPSIASELSERFGTTERLICSAWIMLMFRAFLWSRCHFFCPPDQARPEYKVLPSRYWNSKLPVYLG